MKAFLTAVWNRIANEPALLLGILSSGIVLATAYGAEITEEQANALKGFAGALLLGSVGVRQQVTPDRKTAGK